MERPIFDYSELLEEAQDRIEERLVLEGEINVDDLTTCARLTCARENKGFRKH